MLSSSLAFLAKTPTFWHGLAGFVIEDGVPGSSVVVRLPNSAVDLTDVEHIGLAGDAGRGAGASAAKGANHAPVQFLVSALGNLGPTCGCG